MLQENLVAEGFEIVPWKLEIRVLKENWKERVFLQHIDSLTCIHSCDFLLESLSPFIFLSKPQCPISKG